jgi:hypothetical protein
MPHLQPPFVGGWGARISVGLGVNLTQLANASVAHRFKNVGAKGRISSVPLSLESSCLFKRNVVAIDVTVC